MFAEQSTIEAKKTHKLSFEVAVAQVQTTQNNSLRGSSTFFL